MNDRCDPFYGLRQNPAYRSTLAQLFNEIVRLRSSPAFSARSLLASGPFGFQHLLILVRAVLILAC
jgi:hypothetical protein